MTPLLVGEIGLRELASNPWFWALVLGAIGLSWKMPRSSVAMRRLGAVVALAGVVVLAAALVVKEPISESYIQQGVFWFLAIVTIVAAGAAVTMRDAVYCAIWFALSLLGTGGLFLYQGAQFLGVATVVVYAGAIVVTFLFVVMLAQPEGHASYDRISWGWYVKPFATIASGILLGAVVATVLAIEPDSAPLLATAEQLEVNVLKPAHVAGLGAEVFSRHLISVEIAGTLLMVALVGAIVMMSRTNQSVRSEERRDA
ncbi:MAG: NADH-quinone oxidoreductase subunit J [Planctomycetales bacterium]|nr:NADH-quinone oxidoreductase subunit J [Planctomycetales bacterium]